MGQMECYERDFEEFLLKDTAEYYKRKAAAWIQVRGLQMGACLLVVRPNMCASPTGGQVFRKAITTARRFLPQGAHARLPRYG
jgi:hypothetical protein